MRLSNYEIEIQLALEMNLDSVAAPRHGRTVDGASDEE